MNNLNFDSGLVSFEVNGMKDAVKFNPTDAEFFGRLVDTVNLLQKRMDHYGEDVKKEADTINRFELLKTLDQDIENSIDELFRTPGLCQKIFADGDTHISPTALAGGFPIWLNFLLAVADKADESIKVQEKLSKARVEKYTKKYHK
jgi:hypothetical protein